MPETSLNTRVEEILQHCKKVRSARRRSASLSQLSLNPQRLDNIRIHLGLTKAQTLTVLQRLEETEEIFCRAGVWQLK